MSNIMNNKSRDDLNYEGISKCLWKIDLKDEFILVQKLKKEEIYA